MWDKLHLVLLKELRAAKKLDWSRAVIDSSHLLAARPRTSTTSSPTSRHLSRPGVETGRFGVVWDDQPTAAVGRNTTAHAGSPHSCLTRVHTHEVLDPFSPASTNSFPFYENQESDMMIAM